MLLSFGLFGKEIRKFPLLFTFGIVLARIGCHVHLWRRFSHLRCLTLLIDYSGRWLGLWFGLRINFRLIIFLICTSHFCCLFCFLLWIFYRDWGSFVWNFLRGLDFFSFFSFYICISIRSDLLKRIWCISSTILALSRNLTMLMSFFNFYMARFRYKSLLAGPLCIFSFVRKLRQKRKYFRRCFSVYWKLRRFMIVL